MRVLRGFDLDMERSSTTAPCLCGKVANKVYDVTPDEVKQYQKCGRNYVCCLAAFLCPDCKERFLVHLPAPEMG